jgi:hypothetical protein
MGFVVLYGCETWLLILRVLKRIFGPKREQVTGVEYNFIMKSSMILTPYPLLCG